LIVKRFPHRADFSFDLRGIDPPLGAREPHETHTSGSRYCIGPLSSIGCSS
jgi:hypothetical protein